MSIDIGLLMDPIDGLTPEIDSSTNISVIDEDARSEVSSTATFHSAQDDSQDDYDSPASTFYFPQSHAHDAQLSSDLLSRFKNTYRTLDLVSEQGSGGLVEKIVIDQSSIANFMNDVCPGSYASLSKIDFKSLDNLQMKVKGIYGSKEKIVQLLERVSAIDDTLAADLLASTDTSMGPKLRSGLYLVRTGFQDGVTQVLAIYWPEDETWHDNAISSVRRNRVTFIRYLTKIADHVICLITPEDAKHLSWHDGVDLSPTSETENDDHDSRMFDFEVSETSEQEESVTARPGFVASTENMYMHEISPELANGDPFLVAPMLIQGATHQSILTAHYERGVERSEKIPSEITPVHLKSLLKDNHTAIHLWEWLQADEISILINNGLSEGSSHCRDWEGSQKTLESTYAKASKDAVAITEEKLKAGKSALEAYIQVAVEREISNHFPMSPSTTMHINSINTETSNFDTLVKLNPTFKSDFDSRMLAEIKKIDSYPKRSLDNKRFLVAKAIFDSDPNMDEKTLLDAVENRFQSKGKQKARNVLLEIPQQLYSRYVAGSNPPSDPLASVIENLLRRSEDPNFLIDLVTRSFVSQTPLRVFAEKVTSYTNTWQADRMLRVVQSLVSSAQQIQKDAGIKHQQQAAVIAYQQGLDEARVRFLSHYRSSIPEASGKRSILFIESIRQRSSTRHSNPFHIKAELQVPSPPAIGYIMHPLQLSANDTQELQMNAQSPFLPIIDRHSARGFRLPLGYSIKYLHLMENGRVLLIVKGGHSLIIYSEDANNLNAATQNGTRGARKTLNIDRLPGESIFSYNESTRTLAVCASTDLQLHLFQFDETLNILDNMGHINLRAWYDNPNTIISHMCITSGLDHEDIALIDNSGTVRMFSLALQQFRQSVLILLEPPLHMFPTPDGSCLMLVFGSRDSSDKFVRAYHRSSFGTTEGIELELPGSSGKSLTITSFGSRSNVHLVQLDDARGICTSVAFDIFKKETEFQFKQHGSKNGHRTTAAKTRNNCLLDVHSDVWTRFPVIAAVSRRGMCRHLTFGSDRHLGQFRPYFDEMEHEFQIRTHKSTGSELRNLVVEGVNYESIMSMLTSSDWTGPSSLVGSWCVDVLCLIPLHIAVAQDNRFIPLKDGLTSAEMQRSLLGAEVGGIVDALSFGWYESIFASYMSRRPVKVVSSMGEQSVGKSYMLNHLVDSSFAGSAMRTTEGVWMSVTPTEDSLVVALDFEGVHSIERTAQEDTLLVLFNCAISNLVLFRNNFAMSRDITGLFQSFQSSSGILDHKANPTLFQSCLAIVIKDVVDSDTDEIVKEFGLKFGRIVQSEQSENFISRLHSGKLKIIPWPVIESRKFYTMFNKLRQTLETQHVTHERAGEFLLTLKVLMAKLMANDWSSISQTMISHRAQRLLSSLDMSLATGYADSDSEEPLKNFDTGEVISADDTPSVFFLATWHDSDEEREPIFRTIIQRWADENPRVIRESEWISGLETYLDRIVDLRIGHVRTWIQSNTERFSVQDTNIQILLRTFDNRCVDIKLGLQLCKQKCEKCFLSCTQGNRHDGDHDCLTDHRCMSACEYEVAHAGINPGCGLSGGHEGKHLCIVNEHLCGKICILQGRMGCMEACTLDPDHESDHRCAAQTHACGEPCRLHGVQVNRITTYNCAGLCSQSIEEPHNEHACDNRMCPMACVLCKRLCHEPDHMHALKQNAVHLCGQEHPCLSLCQAEGTCEIQTTPQSVRATFTGRHESFQYTKYSQVSKRLQCAFTIPSGLLEHEGPHVHTLDKMPFHFCEASCDKCGYFCTHPRGHTQQEHETSHGSMSRAQWAVDGPDGAAIELNGHRFAANDDGAPMMCNMVCKEHEEGRHAHIDFCRSSNALRCRSEGLLHIHQRLSPEPDIPKDYISHKLHWTRSGFKDPYPRDDQAKFELCDAMCPGPDHAGSIPSFCTLPLFHAPALAGNNVPTGYRSPDGHIFSCDNPTSLHPAFHVIFIIDRSSSMSSPDRLPVPNTPVSAAIAAQCNNRLGAVYSALFAFWQAREVPTVHRPQNSGAFGGSTVRRDAYSVVLFNGGTEIGLTEDFNSTPQELLTTMLNYRPAGGTNYGGALAAARSLMEDHWSPDRSPVLIFLSDGECPANEGEMAVLCQSAVDRGHPLSFQSVSFGVQNAALRSMANQALAVQNSDRRNLPNTNHTQVNSAYNEVLRSDQLSQTFLEFAEALKKPRGALINPTRTAPVRNAIRRRAGPSSMLSL